MGIVALLGRIMFSALFIFNGVNHFLNLGPMTAYAASKGIPYPDVAVMVTGVMLIVGGTLVLVGKWARFGAALLALFLVPTAILMHNFWTEADATMAMNQMQHFLKNLALAGAALFMTTLRDWPASFDSRRRNRHRVVNEEPRLTITRTTDDIYTHLRR